MKPVTTAMAACTLSIVGAMHAQQSDAPEEQDRQGVPATLHQEQALGETHGDLFSRLDQDRDGAISKQEANAEPALSDSWSEYDQNGDQLLDTEEFAAFVQRSTGSVESEDLELARGEVTEEGLPTTPHQQQVIRNELVERLDEDSDGAISQQEAQSETRLVSEWDRLDGNDDGKLDSVELSRFEQ